MKRHNDSLIDQITFLEISFFLFVCPAIAFIVTCTLGFFLGLIL